MLEFLDRLHRRVRRNATLATFTIFVRVLLAVGFIPPGLTKVLGRPFTTIPAGASPIGTFFDVFHQSGGWYVFVGAMQILAGLLLLVPPAALIGALLYLPIIANIFVITVALDFTGTWVVTGLMTLAVTYLIAWDYHRWRSILFTDPPHLPDDHLPRRLDMSQESAGTAELATGAMVVGALLVLGSMRGLVPGGVTWFGLALCGASGPAAAAAWWVRFRNRFMARGNRTTG